MPGLVRDFLQYSAPTSVPVVNSDVVWSLDSTEDTVPTSPLKIVYIAGLSRSGSTFLQFYLAAQTNFVSLGEISQTLRTVLGVKEDRNPDWPCSCGEPRKSCAFWGPALEEIRGQDVPTAYRMILNQFRRRWPGRVLVDASKTLEALSESYPAIRTETLDSRVIFLIRDFRGWIRSIERRRPYRDHFRDGYIQNAYRWFRDNRRYITALEKMNYSWESLSYENFVFRPHREITRLSEFLEEPLGELGQKNLGLDAHELFGSPSMKFAEGPLSLRYDHSWMSDPRAAFAAPLLLPVWHFNRRAYAGLVRI